MPSEIRQISFSDFRKHMRQEMGFVTQELGHLWLMYRGKPRGVVIPMRDEAVLHRAVGLNPYEAFHRAMVDCDRRITAINEKTQWVSTEVITNNGHGYPPVGMSDETYRQWRSFGPAREEQGPETT